MNWHNVRVGLTCLAAFVVLLSVSVLANYKFGDWAAGVAVPVGILGGLCGVAGVIHIAGWMVRTWEGW
jgi:hypothetical protein